MNILFIANELLQVCGISKHLYHLVDGLQKYYPNNEYFIITGGGNAIQKFQSIGVPVVVNENLIHQTRSITGYIKGIKEVYSFVKRNDIQIIHSHHHYSASIASKVSKLTLVQTIFTNHGILRKKGLLNHFNGDHIIAVNDKIKKEIARMSNKHVHLIRTGMSETSKTNKHTNERLRIISGGRMETEKGFEIFIKAIKEIPLHVRKKADFYIAGSGSLEEELKLLNNDLNTNISFLGEVVDFQQFLIGTDIFVMPTVAEYEGLPTVLIEAALAENLIISSDFFGHTDIINKGNGIIFNKGQVSQLAEKLIEAINNFEKYSWYIKNMKIKATDMFSQHKMINQTYNLYQQALKK
ncbi:glycosyl transferase, group 1 [hydrocarbon metagenome]|uniref:Glycosyl transferase, group 1 n=1 Tax=hydrocarbon metagenome TaxID=938273 RepID=A0A0W8FW29_9ZZZZ